MITYSKKPTKRPEELAGSFVFSAKGQNDRARKDRPAIFPSLNISLNMSHNTINSFFIPSHDDFTKTFGNNELSIPNQPTISVKSVSYAMCIALSQPQLQFPGTCDDGSRSRRTPATSGRPKLHSPAASLHPRSPNLPRVRRCRAGPGRSRSTRLLSGRTRNSGASRASAAGESPRKARSKAKTELTESVLDLLWC